MTLFLLRDGRRRVLLSRYGFTFAHAWSRRGHRFAFAATNRFGQLRIYGYDAARAGPPRPLTNLRYGTVREIAWSPSGRRLLFERTANSGQRGRRRGVEAGATWRAVGRDAP
jgi:Tol biopolymer transport system component